MNGRDPVCSRAGGIVSRRITVPEKQESPIHTGDDAGPYDTGETLSHITGETSITNRCHLSLNEELALGIEG
jgi:hypothetical protein